PEWVLNAMEYFEYHLEAGGDRWRQLLDAWQRFEIHMGYPEGRQFHLPPALRPDEYSQWMKEGRDYEKLPELNNHVAFALQWRTWWASLQPASRRVDGSHTALLRVVPSEMSEWDVLWRGGPSGLFLVVMGLVWWLYAAYEEDSSLTDIHDAIDDVFWVVTT
ncbi:hypothetical protein L226DRAFT_444049, partial [Lentinus tigrinus ALCF2SS1-7]|uniref:uncharacterized protein n=1 Tax=Lentinus tigrinus ALCF2SS1-7 TaxID=1328758 RepID=UPI0011660D9E